MNDPGNAFIASRAKNAPDLRNQPYRPYAYASVNEETDAENDQALVGLDRTKPFDVWFGWLIQPDWAYSPLGDPPAFEFQVGADDNSAVSIFQVVNPNGTQNLQIGDAGGPFLNVDLPCPTGINQGLQMHWAGTQLTVYMNGVNLGTFTRPAPSTWTNDTVLICMYGKPNPQLTINTAATVQGTHV